MVVITTSCIPRRKENFNNFIRTTNTYLKEGNPTNAARLNMPDNLLTVWSDYLARWIGPYNKFSDKINSRTQAVTNELQAIINEARKFDQENHLFARIAIAENATLTDFEVFKIPTGKRQKQNHGAAQMPITDLVQVVLKPIGGGSVSIKCYGKGARASLLESANCVQYRYVVGAVAPTSASDKALEMDISTKGSFILATGAANVGLQLYIYFRWYNTRHPEQAGPWSMIQPVILL